MAFSNHTAGHNYKCCCDSYNAVTVSNIGAVVGLACTAVVLLCLTSKSCRSWLTEKAGVGLNWRSAIFFSVAWPVSMVCMLLAPLTHTAWLYWPVLSLQCLGLVHILVLFGVYVADMVLDIRREGRVSEDSIKATGALYRRYSRCWGVEITPQSELWSRRRDIPLRENPGGGDGEGGGERTADEEEKGSDSDIGTAGTVCVVLCVLSCRAISTAINVAINIWILWIIYKAYECVREGEV